MITLITLSSLSSVAGDGLHIGNRPNDNGHSLIIGRSGDTTQVEICVTTLDQADQLVANVQAVRDAMLTRDGYTRDRSAVR